MIGFSSLPIFICDIPWKLYLNSITKSVSLTSKKMWTHCKLSLPQIHIWECIGHKGRLIESKVRDTLVYKISKRILGLLLYNQDD